MMKLRRSILALGLSAATACLPLFGTSGAILSPMAGSVSVNGQAVTAGSAVVAGDLVATGASGSARMVLPGGLLIAASNTEFRMESVNHADAVRLNNGMVKISGMLPVELNASTVMPATARTQFEVYNLAGKIYVEALAGSVAVKFAKSTTTVAAGRSATYADPVAGAPGQSGMPAAQAAGSLGPPWGVILGGIGAVGGLVGLGLAIHANNTANTACQSVSPAC